MKLLLRELLDNPTRVRTATQLPLAPFLERASSRFGGAHPEIAVLHVVGALSYVVAAWPTVDRIVGASRARAACTPTTSAKPSRSDARF